MIYTYKWKTPLLHDISYIFFSFLLKAWAFDSFISRSRKYNNNLKLNERKYLRTYRIMMIFMLLKLFIYNISLYTIFLAFIPFFSCLCIILSSLKIVYKYWLKMTLCLSKYDIWPKKKKHKLWKISYSLKCQKKRRKTLMKKIAQNDNTIYKDGDLMTYEK